MFNKWCDEQGVVKGPLEWPVAYGSKGELVGVRATKDIGMNESIVYIPTRITISIESFKQSEYSVIYYENEDDFLESEDEHFVLIFFVA